MERQCIDIVGVVCMPMSSKFLTESTGEKIVKIDQYLAKIWTKYDSLLFGPPCIYLFVPVRICS